jgi:hypothetical protein
MSLIDILVNVGAAAVVAGLLIRDRSSDPAVEAEPIPVPVRDRR